MGWKKLLYHDLFNVWPKDLLFFKMLLFCVFILRGLHARNVNAQRGQNFEKVSNDFLLSNNKPVRSTWLTQIISITLLVIIAKSTLFRLMKGYSKSKITMIIIKSLYSLFITVTTANWNIFCHEHVLTCLRSCHKLGILLFYVCEFCKDLFPQCCLKSSWYSF